MQRREAELALFVREDLMARGQAVPEEIENVFLEMKKQAAMPEEKKGMHEGKRARLKDLNKLASSEDVVVKSFAKERKT
jgi:hypothetical protein